MTTNVKRHHSLDTGNARRSTSNTRSSLTFGGFFDLLAKSIVMARAISDAGRVNARDMAKVHRMAEML